MNEHEIEKSAEMAARDVYGLLYFSGYRNQSILALQALLMQKTILPPKKMSSSHRFWWDLEFKTRCYEKASRAGHRAIHEAIQDIKKTYIALDGCAGKPWELAYLAAMAHCQDVSYSQGNYANDVSTTYPFGIHITGERILARVPIPKMDWDNEFYLQVDDAATVSRKVPNWLKAAFAGHSAIPPRVYF